MIRMSGKMSCSKVEMREWSFSQARLKRTATDSIRRWMKTWFLAFLQTPPSTDFNSGMQCLAISGVISATPRTCMRQQMMCGFFSVLKFQGIKEIDHQLSQNWRNIGWIVSWLSPLILDPQKIFNTNCSLTVNHIWLCTKKSNQVWKKLNSSMLLYKISWRREKFKGCSL